MRSRSTHRRPDGPAQGRRHFLQLLGTAPFAVQGTLWLLACGGGDEGADSPYAGKADVDSGDAPAEAAETPRAGGAPETPGAESGGPDAAAADAPGTDAAASGDGGEAKLVTAIAAMQPTVDALKYTHESTTEGQSCENCQFYTGQGDGLGKCQLFTQGLVKAGGWCSSWTKKIETG